MKFTYWDMLWQLLSQIHLLSLQIATETVYLFMLKDLVDGTLSLYYLLQTLFYIHWKLEYVHYHRPELAIAHLIPILNISPREPANTSNCWTATDLNITFVSLRFWLK